MGGKREPIPNPYGNDIEPIATRGGGITTEVQLRGVAPTVGKE